MQVGIADLNAASGSASSADRGQHRRTDGRARGPGHGRRGDDGRDVVNTASRLQTSAPVNAMLVGEETYRATRRRSSTWLSTVHGQGERGAGVGLARARGLRAPSDRVVKGCRWSGVERTGVAHGHMGASSGRRALAPRNRLRARRASGRPGCRGVRRRSGGRRRPPRPAPIAPLRPERCLRRVRGEGEAGRRDPRHDPGEVASERLRRAMEAPSTPRAPTRSRPTWRCCSARAEGDVRDRHVSSTQRGGSSRRSRPASRPSLSSRTSSGPTRPSST